MEKRNESANETMLELTIKQEELGVEKNILIKDIKVLEDKAATLALKKALETYKTSLEINLIDTNTHILNTFLDNINELEYPYTDCDNLLDVAKLVKSTVLDAKKNPHKYAEKKALTQLFNQEQEVEPELNYYQ
ncbi:MAG: hypothetical protein PHQ62_03035 [Clostridia bacterium]|nr:hypothetical protein [Clostridia bacterium]